MLKDILMNPSKYRKFYTALAGFIVTLLTAYVGAALWLPPFVAFLTSVGVLGVSNARE